MEKTVTVQNPEMGKNSNNTDEDLDDDTIDVDSEDDGDEEEEFVAPTKEEWAATRDALAKANAEAKKNRLALRESKKVTPSGDEDDAVAKAQADAEALWKPRVVNAQARAAFAEAGAKNPARLIKMLDLADIDVTDDGELDGLSDQIDELKEEFPELFAANEEPTPRKRAGKIDAAGNSRPNGASPKSSSEKQAQSILGR